MTDGPVDYPASWRPRSAPRQLPAGPAPDVIEALLLAIDSYIAACPLPNFARCWKGHDHEYRIRTTRRRLSTAVATPGTRLRDEALHEMELALAALPAAERLAMLKRIEANS